MGKYNLAVNRLLQRKDIFADLMNGVLFDGQQVLKQEKLELLSGDDGVFYEKEGEEKKIGVLERHRDIRMEADMESYKLVLAGEVQQKVHNAMPVRNMLYDALEYTRQVQEMEKQHKQSDEKLENSDFLSGITREDQIKPVITLVIYLGKDWDGYQSLHEMMNLGNEKTWKILQKYLPDYKINHISVYEMEHTENYHTCLQHIFNMLKYNSDKERLYKYINENREVLDCMDAVETRAALELLGEQKRVEELLRKKEEGGELRMCQAIDELIKDGELRGRKVGLETGIKTGIKTGENRMLDLAEKLVEDSRIEDLHRMKNDENFRKKLYQEYGIE